jgi:uncharacterized protein (TIGR03067 family)
VRTIPLVLLLGLTANAAAAAPVPKHLQKGGDNTEQGKLQGVWKLKSLRVAGMDLGTDQAGGISMTIEIRGDTMTATTSAGNAAPTGITAKIKLDTVGGLKRFTTTGTRKTGADGNPAAAEQDVSAGYAIDGDTLSWAMNPGADGKHTAADPAKADQGVVVFVFTRVKDRN